MSETPPDSQTGATCPKSRRRLRGEMLLEQGVIAQQQLTEVLTRQKAEKGGRLGRLLVDLGYATEAQICEVVAEQLNIPAADLVAVDIPNEVLNHVTKELATKYLCLPWFIEGRELYLIMSDPPNVAAAAAWAFLTGLKIQDGRTFVRVAGKNYDLRVSTLPTAEGEKCVMRILVQDRAKVALPDLGFEPDVLASFQEVLERPQGMVLVTGPTGSGKTSTLYASLNFLRDEATNIVTVEDPIEYRLSGINQVAVSDKAGLPFAAARRTILRQYPDIVM